jgi:alpha-L-fucosidase
MVSGEAMLKQTVNPDPGFAVKEIFFTRNGNTVYAVTPQLPEGKFLIKGLNTSANTTVQMLGLKKPLAFKKVKDGIEVTVPKLSLKEVPCEYAWAFKVTDII